MNVNEIENKINLSIDFVNLSWYILGIPDLWRQYTRSVIWLTGTYEHIPEELPMFDPNLLIESTHEQQRELVRKAELARLMQEGRETQPALPERMLLAVAEALISAGERMREGHPAPASR
jgi:hypothetical protein